MLNLSGPGQTEGFDQKESSRNQRPFKADAQDVARHYPELAEEQIFAAEMFANLEKFSHGAFKTTEFD